MGVSGLQSGNRMHAKVRCAGQSFLGEIAMKYGIMLPSRGELALPDNIIPIAKKAEELGFSVMMFPDHVVLPNQFDSPYPYTQSGIFPATDTNEATEQLTMLAFLAGQTESIRLVTSVMIVPHRPPVLTAKVLSTIDVLSKGRLTVGVGVGWLQKEFEALQTPPFEERGAVTDEYIRMFKELWTSESPSFEGKYHSFSDLSFLPKPVQKPHPPIWVGGESPRAMRRAAELGDGWQPIGTNNRFPLSTPRQIADAMQMMDTYVERAGRPRGSVEIVCRMHGYSLDTNGGEPDSADRPTFSGGAEQIAADIRRYEDMGVSHLIAAFVPVAQLASSKEEMIRDMEELADKVWPKV